MKNLLTHYRFSCAFIVIIWILCFIPIPDSPLSHVTLIDKWTHCLVSIIRSAHIDGTPSNKEKNQTQQSYLLGLAHSNSHGRHYRSVASHLHRR